jgi:xanthine dehydrogenase YagT iron-sulfur-binding subunit
MTSAEGQVAGVTRRRFLEGAAAASAGIVALDAGVTAAGAAEAAGPTGSAIPIRLTVNGKPQQLTVDPRATLLDTLRDRLDLTGPKKGCDRGQCGACTVHVAGRPVVSCLTLAVAVREPVTTVEGLASGDRLHPVQQAFLDQDGLQCGFCTSGQIMSAAALVDRGEVGADNDVREYMSGNICRCSAYPNIVAAVRQAGQGGH